MIEILKEYIQKVIEYDYQINVIKSNRPDLCDYQCDDAFKLAKIVKQSPMVIGQEIVDKLKKQDDFSHYFKDASLVNGFINLKISDELINKVLTKMSQDEKFNLKKPEKKETFFLDYGGPNIAKPLHVGHLRTAIIGEAIKRIINFAGHNTISDVHLGDYGLQMGQVIYGILQDNLKLEDITLEYLNITYPKISKLCKEDDNVLSECARITKELQEGNTLYQQLWDKIYEISLNDIKDIYKYLGVSFDLWLGESDAYKFIPPVTKILEEKQLLKVSDGAKIVEVKEEDDKKEVPPFIYQKSNGAYLYGTTDLVTIYDRVKNYDINHMIYITDARQALHFEQVFRASKKADFTTNINLSHIGYGTVNGSDGKPFKTRNGDAISLRGLLNEIKDVFKETKDTNQSMSEEDSDIITNSIVKFADLQNNWARDYVFDIKKFSEVVGKTGPYILYTYLRINKILSSYTVKNNEFNDLIYNEADRNLRLKILEFPLAIDSAFKDKMPSYIAEYVYDLCGIVNSFYQNNYINTLEDETIKNEWLNLLSLTNRIIKTMLNLLVIEIPSKM